MISRTNKTNFLAAHYDWLVVAFGVLALAGAVVFYLQGWGDDVEAVEASERARVRQMKPKEIGVKEVEMLPYQTALRQAEKPLLLIVPDITKTSFLASERRVLCKNPECRKGIPDDPSATECPFCHVAKEKPKPVVLDADGDGLPDEWEREHGLNPSDKADADGDLDQDGFTNREEYLAKTDPANAKDHPDYLDSLTLALPLKETRLPFLFRQASKVPAGWRCEFFAPGRKDSYGRRGATLTALVGEKIADTDFKVKAFEKKEIKQKIAGTNGLTKSVDVSEVTLERISDGKTLTVALQQGKGAKLAPIDIQATLNFSRGPVKNFVVIPGSEIALFGDKYKVADIKTEGKKVSVILKHLITDKIRVIQALEQ